MEVATKEKNTKRKPSPNTGKVAALADERGKLEQKCKKYFYRTVLNTCLSFLNEVKNLGKEYRCYIRIFSYPMPDSSLRVKLCFFFYHHSGSARRSRMTAGVNYVFERR